MSLSSNPAHINTTPSLTSRQREVLSVIEEHLKAYGAPPTRAEIARKLGFKSVNAAEDHLKALARKGAITLTTGTSRGIQVTGHQFPSSSIPPIPFISCRDFSFLSPPLAPEESLLLDPRLFSLPIDVLLRVDESLTQHSPYQYAVGDCLAIKILSVHLLLSEGRPTQVWVWSEPGHLVLGDKHSYPLNSPQAVSSIGLVLGLFKNYSAPPEAALALSSSNESARVAPVFSLS